MILQRPSGAFHSMNLGKYGRKSCSSRYSVSVSLTVLRSPKITNSDIIESKTHQISYDIILKVIKFQAQRHFLMVSNVKTGQNLPKQYVRVKALKTLPFSSWYATQRMSVAPILPTCTTNFCRHQWKNKVFQKTSSVICFTLLKGFPGNTRC